MLTGLVVLLGAGSAIAIGPRIEAARVEGYLDRAPSDARVVQQVTLGRGDRSRTIYVTVSQALEAGDTCGSCAAMYGMVGGYSVVGDAADVAKLLESPAGAKVSVVLSRPRADRHLLVQDVMTNEDGKTVVESEVVRGSQG